MGPGVFLDPPLQLHRYFAAESTGRSQHPVRVHRQRSAVARRQRTRASVGVIQQVGRQASYAGQPDAPRGLSIAAGEGRPQRYAGLAAVQLGQVGQAFQRSQLGIADIQHDHAGDEPEHHQQAAADAQPAVPQVQVAFHRRLLRSASARSARRCAGRRRSTAACSARSARRPRR